MTDTSVKYFHSEMPGAPVLNGTPGALISVLDACIVNGWGLITADSVTITDNVATFARAAGVTFEVGQVVIVAGATVIGGSINGEQRVTAVTANSWSFAVVGVANQIATGTVTAKVASAGWNKPYTSTNKAAYKPNDVTATGCLLRIDDTATTTARLVGYESMTGIDSGMGKFPTDAQINGGVFWLKSNQANISPRKWMIVSDGRLIYVIIFYTNDSPKLASVVVFGDPITTKSGDAFGCILSGESSDRSVYAPNSSDCLGYSSANTAVQLYCARSYTGLGSAISLYKSFPVTLVTMPNYWSGGVANAPSFPNPTNGGLYVAPYYLTESINYCLRGVFPGMWPSSMNIAPGTFSAKDKITGVVGLPGRTLIVATVYGSGNAPYSTPLFFDITGPWR